MVFEIRILVFLSQEYLSYWFDPFSVLIENPTSFRNSGSLTDLFAVCNNFNFNTDMELQCVEVIKISDQIIEEAYYAANPDVKKSGMRAKEHFENHGKFEPVRVQFINVDEVIEMRREKLKKIKFRENYYDLNLDGYAANLLDPKEKDEIGNTDTPPISCNQYDEKLMDEIRNNPDKKYLDVGAGLRTHVFSNVFNTEIYPYISTDIICIGENLPFADNQFDKVLCIAVLEHTRKPWEVAKELVRVLKPGGKLHIDYPFLQPVHGYPHHYFNATPKGNASLF